MWHHLRARIDTVRLRDLHPNIREHQTVDILRGLPEGSRLSLTLFGIFAADLKLNCPTPLLVLPLAHNTLGQCKSGLVGYFTLMTSRSCACTRANCKPCYMSSRNRACEIVCKSTHSRQKSWLSLRPSPFKRPLVASTSPAQHYPTSTFTRPSQPLTLASAS